MTASTAHIAESNDNLKDAIFQLIAQKFPPAQVRLIRRTSEFKKKVFKKAMQKILLDGMVYLFLRRKAKFFLTQKRMHFFIDGKHLFLSTERHIQMYSFING